MPTNPRSYINLGHGADLRSKSVEAMRAQCEEVLDAAYACGIRRGGWAAVGRRLGGGWAAVGCFCSPWAAGRSLRQCCNCACHRCQVSAYCPVLPHVPSRRYCDAARSYGRAEDFLSGWLQSRAHR